MALPVELAGLGTAKCARCSTSMPLSVCKSAAGYYLGHWCENCGPYSRETGYTDEATALAWLQRLHAQEGNE